MRYDNREDDDVVVKNIRVERDEQVSGKQKIVAVVVEPGVKIVVITKKGMKNSNNLQLDHDG